VVEKTGRIMVFNAAAHETKAQVFLDLTERVRDSSSEQGVLALAFHPDWKKNRQFYIWWTSTEGATREDRLSRFSISATDANVADPASEQPMIAQADRAGNHNGGELAFGPDGYLYVSIGDEGAGDDRFGNSQRIDKNFFSCILRLDVDRKPGSLAPNPHPAVRPGAYTIPADNPWVGAKEFNGKPVDPAAVRTEFWAVGLRNPWRMSFDSATGKLWCGDVGQSLHEEVDIIVRGGNYGWNVREGLSPFAKGQPAPADPNFIDPVWDYPRSQGISISGGLVYHGKSYPDLEGKYLFADYAFGKIWALDPDGDKTVGPERVTQIATGASIVSFARDPQTGDVLLASLAGGKILRLVPNPKVAK
jgi:glucose/arabinose dehydrogenase